MTLVEETSVWLLGVVVGSFVAINFGNWIGYLIVGTGALLSGHKVVLGMIDIALETDNMALSVYWAMILACTLPLIHSLSKRKNSRAYVIILRKFFHLVVLLLFLPPLMLGSYDRYMALAGVYVLSMMVLVETFRVMSPPSNKIKTVLTRAILPLLDAKDTGSTIVTSHMELLVASLGPCWINQIVGSGFTSSKIFLFSGLLTVGIGDSAAAIGGLSMGRPHKLPGSKKSIEGMISFCATVMISIHVLDHVSPESIFAILVSALAECYVTNHDNILLPIVFTTSSLAARMIEM